MIPYNIGESHSKVVISTKRVSEILQISPRTVRRMAESEQLPATKIGGQWRFSKPHVLALLPKP